MGTSYTPTGVEITRGFKQFGVPPKKRPEMRERVITALSSVRGLREVEPIGADEIKITFDGMVPDLGKMTEKIDAIIYRVVSAATEIDETRDLVLHGSSRTGYRNVPARLR